MSYILEALADSEQAREQVAAAPRHSLLPVVGEDTSRQRVWPYALAGALLLNVAVLALWQRPASSGDAAPIKAPTLPQAAPTVPQAAPTVSQAAPAVPLVAETAAAEPRIAPSGESPKLAVAIADIVLRETKLPPTQPERAEDRRNLRLPAPAAAIPRTVSANPANDSAPMLKLSAPKTIAKPRAELAVATAATPLEPNSAAAPATIVSVAAPVAPASAAAPAQPAPAAAGGTELPPMLQKEMPALTVAGFIHGEGSSSMVIVNDRLVREGDEVAPGVKLEKILGDKLVFNYKGYRFKR